MTSRLRWKVLRVIAPATLVALAACPGTNRIAQRTAGSITNPHLLIVRRLVNPCLTVVGQVFVSDSAYQASREEAVQEANAVRDSIGQAVSQAAGRGQRSGGA